MPLPSVLHPEPVRNRGPYLKVAIGVVIAAIVLGSVYWIVFRFHSEDATVDQFVSQVIAGNFRGAYNMWEKGSSYAYSDFLQDWGPSGYYGPVHSFRIVETHEPPNASGVIVVVDVSSYPKFPPEDDIAMQQRTKQVRLWVQFSDHSISYAP